MISFKSENRDRKIRNITSRLPRKKTVRTTWYVMITVGYVYLHYVGYAFFSQFKMSYVDMLFCPGSEVPKGVTEGNLLLFMLLHILDLSLIIMYYIENKNRITLFINNIWELFPD